MPEPISALTIIKQLKDTAPTIQAAWSKVTDANERKAALRLIGYMETKRIFHSHSFEQPKACYDSCQNVMTKIEEERARLPKDDFNKLLLSLMRACNKFKTALDKLNLSESKQYDGQLEEVERRAFWDALLNFRYDIGVQIAAIGESWRVEVPLVLIPEDLMLSLFPKLKTRESEIAMEW